MTDDLTPSVQPITNGRYGPDSWRYRRWAMAIICLFCAITIWITIIFLANNPLAGTIISMSFGIIGTTLTTYVFGAVWDNKRKG
ncbi:MAG: hypothetical protein ACR2PR_08750 [Pseudohongiellaceae bacterium]